MDGTIEQRLKKLELAYRDFEEDLRKTGIDVDCLFSEIKKIKEKLKSGGTL